MMTIGARILCVGAAHWDVIGRASVPLAEGADVPGRIQRRSGGVALNIARGVAVLEGASRLCSVVGDDGPECRRQTCLHDNEKYLATSLVYCELDSSRA